MANRHERRKAASIARKGKGKHVVGNQQIDVRRTTSALIKALIATDASEKQFWAETALRMFLEDEWVDNAKKHYQWQDGVPPNDIKVPSGTQPKQQEVSNNDRKDS